MGRRLTQRLAFCQNLLVSVELARLAPLQKTDTKGALMRYLFAGVLALLVAALTFCSPSAKKAERADGSAAARAICKQFVERGLHDPSSADWGNSWDWPTAKQSDGSWSVSMEYRAKNAFGATVLQRKRCDVLEERENSWKLLSMR